MIHIIKNILKSLLICLVIVCCGINSLKAQKNTKASTGQTVIIINSYSNCVNWSKTVADSITNQLQNWNENLSIINCNLEYNNKASRFISLDKIYFLMNEYPKASLVITIGNEAKQFFIMGKQHQKAWLSTPYIYSGIYDSLFVSSKDGIKEGIVLTPPITENINLAKTLVPNLRELYFIDKSYPTSKFCSRKINYEIQANHSNINFKTMFLGLRNTAAIYELLKDNNHNKDKAIITYSWNFYDDQFKMQKSEIDTILANCKIPVISLCENDYYSKHIVGGYNLSSRICAEKTIDKAKKILSGNKNLGASIEVVKNGEYIFNTYALNNFHIRNNASKYFGVTYVNEKQSKLVEYKIPVAIIALGIILLFILIFDKRKERKHSKQNKLELAGMNNNLKTLDAIFRKSNLNFAVYGINGAKAYELVNEQDSNIAVVIREYFPKNLFAAQFLSKEDAFTIKSKKAFTKEFNSAYLKKFKNSDDVFKRIINVSIGAILSQEEENFKYIVLASDVTSTMADRVEKDILANLIKDATQITNIGVAHYNILTGEGHASDDWYKNLEEKNTGEFITPNYDACSIEDKAIITDFKQKLISATTTKGSFDLKIQNVVNGKERWVKEFIFMQQYEPQNNIIEVIDVNYDITKEKIKENSLKKLNEKAGIANNDSEKFINGISHEIRTPLTSIVGFCQMLANISKDSEKEEITNIIKRNNVVLIELVNKILAIAKIDSGTYTFNKAPVNLHSVFNELKTATEHILTGDEQFKEKKIELIVDIPSENHIIKTDEYNLRQVLVNLLSNAIKYTDEGTVIFGYQPQPQEDGFYFYVKDTGCGIPLENQEKIFNKFEKFNEASHGTGLGLSLCKSIVTHLNGEIGVISKPGEGSTFWFILKNDNVLK